MVPDRISRILTAYVDGELNAHQQKAVARLLRRSAQARELLRGLQNDAEQLCRLPRQTLGPEFSEQILHLIASRKVESARRSALAVRSRIPAWLGLATAAAVLLVIALGTAVYFATVDRQMQNGFAFLDHRPPRPDRMEQPEEVAPPIAKSSQPERLEVPVLESVAKAPASPQVGRTQDGIPPSESKLSPPLGSPLRDPNIHLEDPQGRLFVAFPLQNLDPEKGKQLHQVLQNGTVHALDLRCTNTVAGMARLQDAFQAQGIRLVLDPDAAAALKLGMGRNATFALYFDDVTAEELVAVLQQLSREDQNTERKPNGSGRFESLVVNAMPREEQQKLWRHFGMDPTRAEPPMVKRPASADSRKALPATTEEGSVRAESVKPAPRPLDRQGLGRAYPSSRVKPIPAELKQLLDHRGERRAGTLQIFLVLSATKS